MESPTFCVYPWIQLASKPDGRLNLCCLATETILTSADGEAFHLEQDSVQDIWNSEVLRQIRNEMLAGKKVRACEVCYRDEESGKTSLRQVQNEEWKGKLGHQEIQRRISESESLDGKLASLPVYLDLRIENKCNLRCRMCFPQNSTGLTEEFKRLLETETDFPRFYENLFGEKDRKNWSDQARFISNMELLMPFLKEIYLTGGEPMLLEGTYQLLKKAVDRGFASQIRIKFHTNTTIWNERIIQLFPYFKSVHITCSIDGVEGIDEYVRFPTRFSKVDENFSKYQALAATIPQMTLSVGCSVSLYNVFHLDRLIEWYLEKKEQYSKVYGDIHFSVVYFPSILSLHMIPPSFRESALTSVSRGQELLKNSKFPAPSSLKDLDSILLQLTSNQTPMKSEIANFLSFQRSLDTSRKQNVADFIPEVFQILSFYQSNEPTAIYEIR